MKLKIILTLIVIFLVGSTVAFAAQDNQAIEKIIKQNPLVAQYVQGLNDTIKSLTDKNASLEQTLKQQQDQINQLNQTIAQQQLMINNQQDQISNLTVTMATYQQTISDLQATNEQLQNKVNSQSSLTKFYPGMTRGDVKQFASGDPNIVFNADLVGSTNIKVKISDEQYADVNLMYQQPWDYNKGDNNIVDFLEVYIYSKNEFIRIYPYLPFFK